VYSGSVSLRRNPAQVAPPLPLFGAVLRPFQAFFELEASSGIVLLAAAIGALLLENLGWAGPYEAALAYPITLGAGAGAVSFTLHTVVNDGLMTVFFFVVGMEIKRELVVGELRTRAQASLPAVAAFGGMLVPAAVYLAFNSGGPAEAGWAIPMATDIAFAIGVLKLLGRRVPYGLVVFLTALAIFDDIGGIAVIAIFYGTGFHPSWLLATLGVGAVLAVLNRAYVRNGVVWGLGGAALWWTLHHAGIHATLAGVALGLAIPARARSAPREVLHALASHARDVVGRPHDEELDREEIVAIEERLEDLEAPLTRLLHLLHPWVAFGVMPLFAFTNAGVDLRSATTADLLGTVAVGTALGLVVGKAVGIFGFAAAAVRLGLAPMPGGASYAKLLGVSIIGGIGFTVALFIAMLAFRDAPELLVQAKVGVLVGSLVAGVAGGLLLRATPPPR
jgi:NhaA family Na+:H+ antiporter